MPATVSKSDGGYSVRTPNRVHAKHTTKKKALAQQRLLNAIDHGFKPEEGGDLGAFWGNYRKKKKGK
jgi:hypothetical protein